MTPAGHLGPDHRRGRRQRRHGRRPGQQVRGLRRVDQRPRSRAPAATSSPTPRPGATRRSTSAPRPATEAADGHPASSPTRRPRSPTCRCPTRAPCSGDVRPPTRAASWSTGRSSTTTTAGHATSIDDLGWARYPETVAGEESRPPIGGINIGVGAFSEQPDVRRSRPPQCITVRGEPGDLRRARPATCRPARRRTTTPSCRSSSRPTCWSCSATSIDTAAPGRRRRTGRRSSARRPEHVAPADVGEPRLDAGGVGDVHRRRPAREGAAVTSDRDRA